MHTKAATTNLPLGKKIVFTLATNCGWLLLLLLGHLTRIQYIGREKYDKLRSEKRPFIVCIWHGKMLIPIFFLRYQNVYGLVSQHTDGEMIAQTLQRLGFDTVRGSSTRGGSRAMIELIRILKKGATAAIVPDGPNGPALTFKPGTIAIAAKAGAVLMPLTFASSKYWCFKSWDSFTIPKPFSKTFALFGDPISVVELLEKKPLEDVRRIVEDKMLAVEKRVEDMCAP